MEPWIRTYIKGVTYKNPEGSSRQTILRSCKKGDIVTLIRDPNNPYDGNAVKVCVTSEEKSGFLSRILGGKAVTKQLGYLSRNLASKLAPLMDKGIPFYAEIREFRDSESTEIYLSGTQKQTYLDCLIEITAHNIHWDEERNPIPIHPEFGEPYKPELPEIINDKEKHDSDSFAFDVDEVNKEELSACKVDDYVKLWKPPGASEAIRIYRSGTIGVQGRIGFVPRKYSEMIASHMDQGLPVESDIAELKKDKCKIRCRLVSREEVETQREDERRYLRKELEKKYTPRKGFSFSLQLPENHKLKQGQSLYLKENTTENYAKSASSIRIEFVDENGNVVAHKENEPNLIRRILRASFSGYEPRFKILNISHPDKYTLRYLDSIEATAKVDFQELLEK